MWMEAMRNFTIGQPEQGKPGLLPNPPQMIENYIKGAVVGDHDADSTPKEQFDFINANLAREITNLRRNLGQTDGVGQPMSSLSAASLVLDVFDELGQDQLGRVAIRKLEAIYRPMTGGKRGVENVTVKMDLSFFADDDTTASRNYTRLLEELRDREWCIEVDEKGTDAFRGENTGIATDNLEIQVNVEPMNGAQAAEEETAAAFTSNEAVAAVSDPIR